MPTPIRKCRSDGYCPSPTETECPVCFEPFEYYCLDCTCWSISTDCVHCSERVACEERLHAARRSADLPGARTIVAELVTRYPGRTEYRALATSLDRVASLMERCRSLEHAKFESFRDVRQARVLLSETQGALRIAGFAPGPELAHWNDIVSAGAAGLTSAELMKHQIMASVPTAAAAGAWTVLLWSASHLIGLIAAVRAPSAGDVSSHYLWTRSAICLFGLSPLVGYMAQGSWRYTAATVALISSGCFAAAILFTGLIGSYWPGLFLSTAIVVATVAYFEAGVPFACSAEAPFRDKIREFVHSLIHGLSPRARATAVVGAVFVFVTAPCWHAPVSPRVQSLRQFSGTGSGQRTPRVTARSEHRMMARIEGRTH